MEYGRGHGTAGHGGWRPTVSAKLIMVIVGGGGTRGPRNGNGGSGGRPGSGSGGSVGGSKSSCHQASGRPIVSNHHGMTGMATLVPMLAEQNL